MRFQFILLEFFLHFDATSVTLFGYQNLRKYIELRHLSPSLRGFFVIYLSIYKLSRKLETGIWCLVYKNVLWIIVRHLGIAAYVGKFVYSIRAEFNFPSMAIWKVKITNIFDITTDVEWIACNRMSDEITLLQMFAKLWENFKILFVSENKF